MVVVLSGSSPDRSLPLCRALHAFFPSPMRTLVPLAASLLLAACDRDPEPAGGVRPVAAACVSRSEGTRWAGAYREATRFGDSEEEGLSGVALGGIAATDSIVYVMETGRAALWLLRPDLSAIRRVGREGDGPGEWRRMGAFPNGGSLRRVSASAHTVRIFDGRRVQEFQPGGRFRRVLVNGGTDESLSHLQSRLIYAGDTLFYSAGGYDPLSSALTGKPSAIGADSETAVDGRRLWAVHMRGDGEDRLLLRLGLVPVSPRTGAGPAQALPLWDSDGDCVIASDGAEPLLVYAPVGGKQDTMTVSLPERVDRNENYADMLGGVLPSGIRLAEPSAPARVQDLILDPDGFVWLLPVQPDEPVPGGVEVLRVPLGGGTAVTDTVPAFPRAFGPPGVYFGAVRGSDDEMFVVRYERVGA